MSVAIKIESVSKLYRLGTVGTGTIAHDLNRWWHQIRGKEDPYAKVGQVNDRTQSSTSSTKHQAPSTKNNSAPDYVWAIRDINLEVQQGEVLGIIGRNGAGKSTLLKLLSRVTAPTTGSIKTKGRIASLLEVGTGFHPDLTGRENIYMNGAILGMRRHEITRQLDEIVEFSGCAKYLDTPVKRYSSGMTVRLGFAVAAHLACEILIVDEVLAVGDIEFQKKCMNRMHTASSQEGKAVLFVSHNLTAIESLSHTGILLENGLICNHGSIASVAQKYADQALATQDIARKTGTSIIREVRLVSVLPDVAASGWEITFEIQLSITNGHQPFGVDFVLRHRQTPVAFGSSAYFSSVEITQDTQTISCTLGPLNLAIGTYVIDLYGCIPMVTWLEEHKEIVEFSIEKQLGSKRVFALNASRDLGYFVPPQRWI
jgi:ABC-type polysaccharide/polyol phosphate transport system ATPase subunit